MLSIQSFFYDFVFGGPAGNVWVKEPEYWDFYINMIKQMIWLAVMSFQKC